MREIAVWHILDHDNIVPFVGIFHPDGEWPCLISEWICNGALTLSYDVIATIFLRG